MTSLRPTTRRVSFVVVRLAFVLGLVPLLMAPTCGDMSPGKKTFARGSLIIPMDVCYQDTGDQTQDHSNGYTSAGCPQGKAKGDVIRAYGLVYELIRHDVAVYWIINPSKSDQRAIDLTLQYNGGAPALLWNWAASGGGQPGNPPTSGHVIDYRGGPFVIDGSDYAKAKGVLDLPAVRSTFSGVNVHWSNVAFTADVAKTMAGGWTAGGNIAPKLALLDIGSSNTPCNGSCATTRWYGRPKACWTSSDCNRGDTCGNFSCDSNDNAKNAEIVLQGYLQKAGLDVAGNGGTTAAGAHGAIFDRLFLADFVPDTAGDWTTSNLYRNGYQVLWVPHWEAPGSCSDCPPSSSCTCNTKYPAGSVPAVLKTVGAFSAAGHDVFAECAGLGSFEGVVNNTSYSVGDSTTHFQTTATTGAGLSAINVSVGSVNFLGSFASPLMQIGDFDFKAVDGAIQNYQPTAYKSETIRLVSDQAHPTYDIFTMVPRSDTHGTVVYLAGHDYSGNDGTFEVAGSRMVLNTLFNLGAACQETGVACNTGLLGECAKGVMSCKDGKPYCMQLVQPTEDVCDGKDNDCNGIVDDGPHTVQACYDGPPATRNVGLCHEGVSTCKNGAMTACIGEVLPSTEICNGLDDACTGHADQILVNGTWQALTGACYTGPSTSLDPTTKQPRGICKAGIAACVNGTWGACPVCTDTVPDAWQHRDDSAYKGCQILPMPQDCSSAVGKTLDMACQGSFTCGCAEGASQPCYDGPTGTAGVGICHGGTRFCHDGTFGECQDQQTPRPVNCTSADDNDCNGVSDKDESTCHACPAAGDPSLICPIASTCPGTNGDGTPCAVAWITPADGDVACTTSATCGANKCIDGFCRATCTPGTAGCVPAGTCQNGARACAGGEFAACSSGILPSVEVCDGKDNNCNGEIDENPDQLCGPNLTCVNGLCVPATCGVESPYLEGYDCESGRYQVGNCGEGAACPAGQSCRGATCIDKCVGVQCGEGDICTGGTCTGGGCFLTGCGGGQVCDKGICVPDPCASLTCPSGTFCRAGDCVQSCVFKSCPTGQICTIDGFCETDRCANASCGPGKRCNASTGDCEDNPCASVSCGARQVCVDGKCEDDPCNDVKCEVGVCSGGQCYPAAVHDDTHPKDISSGGGGCGCGSGAGTPLSALLLLALFPFFRRRRAAQAAPASGRRRGPGGSALLLVLALVALSGAACKGSGSTKVDLSTCTSTCPGENRCIDLNYDPAHCGRCDTTCKSGEVCSDAVCGPAGDVAPYITAATPDQASPRLVEPVTLALTGQRFAVDPGTVVRAVSPSGVVTYPLAVCSDTVKANCVSDASHLTVALDLSETDVSNLDLRVVNPDHVISNGMPFYVRSLGASIDSVDPSSVSAGTTQELTVKGTGFSASSTCRVAASPTCGGATTGFVLSTTRSGNDLICRLDATTLALGTYNLWVINDAATSSNCKPVQVVSAKPELFSISPSTGQTGAFTDITVSGSGFDITSTVYFTPPSGSEEAVTTTLIDSGRLFVHYKATQAGEYTVRVRNGSVAADGTATFQSIANPPVVDGVSVYPTGTAAGVVAFQGDAVTMDFSGSFLSGGGTTPTGITIVPPTGSSFDATLGTYSATAIRGTASLLNKPDGLYTAYVTFSVSGSTVRSTAVPFRVLSNVAVLQSVSPAGGQQGVASRSVVLTASNLRGTTSTINVILYSGTTAIQTVHPTSVTLPNSASATLNLSGLETGTYLLAVQNENAAVSNQVTFSVSPGQPTVTSLAVNGGAASTAACVVQSDTPATVVINGSNFAKPDSGGNGGSQVMFTPDGGATWSPIPATYTVTSTNLITATFDTRNAPSGQTYPIQVWNPPGPMKSVQNVTLKIAASSCP
jgi:hypothetical protein